MPTVTTVQSSTPMCTDSAHWHVTGISRVGVLSQCTCVRCPCYLVCTCHTSSHRVCSQVHLRLIPGTGAVRVHRRAMPVRLRAMPVLLKSTRNRQGERRLAAHPLCQCQPTTIYLSAGEQAAGVAAAVRAQCGGIHPGVVPVVAGGIPGRNQHPQAQNVQYRTWA